MGRGTAETIEENLLYGPASRRRRRSAARSPEDLRLVSQTLSELDDDVLLESISGDEIITILRDPRSSNSLKTRLAVLLRDGGWRARVPAGTRMISDFHPQRRPEPLKRSQTVKVDWVFASHEDRNERRVVPAQLRWAGSGGYWRDAELHPGVELIRPGS